MFYTHTSFASEFVYSFQLPTGDEFMTELWVIHIYNFRSIIFYLAQRLCFSPESYNSQGHRFSTLHGILSLSMSEILRLNIEVLLSYFQFGNRFPIVIDNSKLLQIEHWYFNTVCSQIRSFSFDILYKVKHVNFNKTLEVAQLKHNLKFNTIYIYIYIYIYIILNFRLYAYIMFKLSKPAFRVENLIQFRFPLL